MYDISLTMPAIRQHNWKAFYDSAYKSSEGKSFELVMVSPFPLPKELEGIPNITHIIDRGNPSRATQIANIAAKGNLIYNCVDDGLFFNNAISWVVEAFNNNPLGEDDVINMRYRESAGRDCPEFPINYWNAWTHAELRKISIHPSWIVAMHFVMRKSTYMKYGGIDCQFEYSTYGIQDLLFRIQASGGRVYNSSVEGLNCTHYIGITKDHKPIHDAQTYHDLPIFNEIYSYQDAAIKRKILDINNWKLQPDIWTRRFTSEEIKNYVDLPQD